MGWDVWVRPSWGWVGDKSGVGAMGDSEGGADLDPDVWMRCERGHDICSPPTLRCALRLCECGARCRRQSLTPGFVAGSVCTPMPSWAHAHARMDSQKHAHMCHSRMGARTCRRGVAEARTAPPLADGRAHMSSWTRGSTHENAPRGWARAHVVLDSRKHAQKCRSRMGARTCPHGLAEACIDSPLAEWARVVVAMDS